MSWDIVGAEDELDAIMSGEDDEYAIGAEEIIGADDYEEIISGDEDDEAIAIGAEDDLEALLAASSGAVRPFRRGMRGMRVVRRAPRGIRRVRTLPAGAKVAMLRKTAPTKRREYPLPFTSTGTVAAGGTQDIAVRPQVPFRARRLVVPSTIAGSFNITDVKVGKNSAFAASGAVSALIFAETAFGMDLALDTAVPGHDITVSVANTSGAALTFRATLIGTAME